MLKFHIILFSIFIFLLGGCSSQESSSINSKSKEMLTMVEKRMEKGEELTKEEQTKFDLYFEQYYNSSNKLNDSEKNIMLTLFDVVKRYSVYHETNNYDQKMGALKVAKDQLASAKEQLKQ